MTDYSELVKALRYCSTTKEMVYCNVSCKYGWEERSGGCKDLLMTDAADAIEALQADMKTYGKTAFDEGYAMGFAAGEDRAEKQLPKRGEWKTRDDVAPYKPDGEITSWTYRCSVCGDLSRLKYNYCPNCGAKMEVQDADT